MKAKNLIFIITICLFYLPFAAKAANPIIDTFTAGDLMVDSGKIEVNIKITADADEDIIESTIIRDLVTAPPGTVIKTFEADIANTNPSAPPSEFKHIISGLSDGSKYNLSLKVCKKGAEPEECTISSEITANTNPAKLTGLGDTSKTSTTITLGWDEMPEAGKYEICFSNAKGTFDASNSADISGISQIFNVYPLGLETPLVPDTSYYVKARACLAGVGLIGSTCKDADAIAGCSSFTHSDTSDGKIITTLKEINIEELKSKYEKLNLKYQSTLGKYKQYATAGDNKLLDYLEVATRDDYALEIGDDSNGFIKILKEELVLVKGLSVASEIENKYNSLNNKSEMTVLKYKLKMYKKLNGYYKKFDDYKEEIIASNPFKTNFDTHIGDKATVSSAIMHYYDLLSVDYDEKDIAAIDISTETVDSIKSKYSSLVKDNQYKFTSLIYKQLRYLKRVLDKLDSYKLKVDGYSDKGKILATTKASYEAIINTAKGASGYQGYIDVAKWASADNYNNISSKYKEMRKFDGYKKAATIAKGLKRINSILISVYDNDKEISDFYTSINGSPDVKDSIEEKILAIKNKSFYHKDKIFQELQTNSLSFEKRIVNVEFNPYEIYKSEIKTYNKHKVYGYFYKGYGSLKKLLIDKINVLNSIIEILECGYAQDDLKSAEGYANNAKEQLLQYDLDSFTSMKATYYPQFKTFYKQANESYKSALSEAKKCSN
ncbi:MAG: hypothetical protein ABIE43_03370 [Patescibacteria group bacterium]